MLFFDSNERLLSRQSRENDTQIKNSVSVCVSKHLIKKQSNFGLSKYIYFIITPLLK